MLSFSASCGFSLFALLIAQAVAPIVPTTTQVATTSSCCSIDPNSVSSSTRVTWCAAQVNSCNALCDELTTINTCDSDTLEYTCTCSGSTTPSVSDYSQTIPYFECLQWRSDCIAASGTNATAQFACTSVSCGNKAIPSVTIPATPISSSVATSAPKASSSSSSSSSSSFLASTISAVLTNSAVSTNTNSILSAASTARAAPSASVSSTPSTKKPGTSHGEFSSGDIAAVAIGSILGIVIIVIVAYFLSRQRRSKRGLGLVGQRSELNNSPIPEMDTPLHHERPELYSHDPYRNSELHGSTQYPSELDTVQR